MLRRKVVILPIEDAFSSLTVAPIIIFMFIVSTAGENPNTGAENGDGDADPDQLTVKHDSD